MKIKTIKLKEREKIGKETSKKLRNEGLTPCTIYGGNKPTRHLYGFVKDFRDLAFTPDVHKVNLIIEGKQQKAVIQESQFHPLSDDVLHMDFLRVTEESNIKISLPVSFTGNPAGVLNGGRLFKKVRNLQVSGKVKNIPHQLEVDVSGLDNGDGIKVKDLSFKGLKILTADTVSIASVALPKRSKKAAAT